jgi:hypothetical protein
MMFFDSSAISGMSWSAWRKDAAASPKPRSKAVTARPSSLRLRSLGVVWSEASSGGTFLALWRYDRVGMPSFSMMPEKRDSLSVPNASRMEPATSWSFFWSWVE